MFENVDGRTTEAGVTGIQIAHFGAFGSGELIKGANSPKTFGQRISVDFLSDSRL